MKHFKLKAWMYWVSSVLVVLYFSIAQYGNWRGKYKEIPPMTSSVAGYIHYQEGTYVGIHSTSDHIFINDTIGQFNIPFFYIKKNHYFPLLKEYTVIDTVSWFDGFNRTEELIEVKYLVEPIYENKSYIMEQYYQYYDFFPRYIVLNSKFRNTIKKFEFPPSQILQSYGKDVIIKIINDLESFPNLIYGTTRIHTTNNAMHVKGQTTAIDIKMISRTNDCYNDSIIVPTIEPICVNLTYYFDSETTIERVNFTCEYNVANVFRSISESESIIRYKTKEMFDNYIEYHGGSISKMIENRIEFYGSVKEFQGIHWKILVGIELENLLLESLFVQTFTDGNVELEIKL